MDVRLDAPLPESLVVGRGTAVFVAGTCFAPGERIEALALLVDGAEQALMAHGMPRLDLLRAEGEPASYAAGFWGFARVGPRAGGVVELGLRARLAGGGERTAELARIPIAEPLRPAPGDPLVAICMAAFEAPPELFRRQVESIRAQTLGDWLCVVSDDCSDPARYAEMLSVLDGDPRFVVARSDRRRGFYHNFERALELAPAGARFVALADQDDVWDPDKLETLVREIGDAQLVYSDQRIVSEDGDLIAPTYWERRANNHSDMLSLLVANCVTGAASLFRRELLADALPLPPAQFTHFHDHWLAVTALALGEIRYVDRPLYAYVQHGQAAIGHATATRVTRLRERWYSLQKGLRERVRLWRMHYFIDACRLLHFATILEMRCGGRMSAPKGRAVARLLRAERSPWPVPGLFARGARELTRRRPETLGMEWVLAYAFMWRRLLAATARRRPQRAVRIDALPPALAPAPRARLPADPELRAVALRIQPLRLAVRETAPRRVNVLVPALDESAAPWQLALRLAARGMRVRMVTTDPAGPMRRTTGALEVAYGRESLGLECRRDDSFVATNWSTAHVAHAAAGRFVYLIDEYAPLHVPPGGLAALAAQSYRLPHDALYASQTLADYFGAAGAAVFQEPVAALPGGSGGRRLLFHAGPEPEAAFELGVLALSRAGELGAFARGWTLHASGIARRIDLGGGDWLHPADDGAYDVGLALVHAPQPGRAPLAMAAGGMVVVTSTFETKTAAALAAISPDLIGAEPTVEGIARALCEATARGGGAGAPLSWSRSWDESFSEALLSASLKS